MEELKQQLDQIGYVIVRGQAENALESALAILHHSKGYARLVSTKTSRGTSFVVFKQTALKSVNELLELQLQEVKAELSSLEAALAEVNS